MAETRNPYEILRVSEAATEQDIKRSHRQLVVENHPDTHPDDPNAEQRMKDINWAWGELGTPEKRAATDDRLKAARQQARANVPPPPAPPPPVARQQTKVNVPPPPRATPPPTRAPAPIPPDPQRSDPPWGAILFGLGLMGVLFGSAAASQSGSTRAPRARWDSSVGRYRDPDGRFTRR